MLKNKQTNKKWPGPTLDCQYMFDLTNKNDNNGIGGLSILHKIPEEFEIAGQR